MLKQKQKNIIVDAGNTRVKVAVFVDNIIESIHNYSIEDWSVCLNALQTQRNSNSLICSVLDDRKTKELEKVLLPTIVFSAVTKTPLDFSGYHTVSSLGSDRKANSVAAWKEIKTKYGLVIDVGTCVKFDLVQSDGKYLGGSISPGLNMRLKALSNNTGRLPYVTNIEDTELVGTSTESAILSGCLNGWKAEINGFLSQYKTAFDDLTIFLTGGDMYLLDSLQKNGIFADENLTLKGLNLILAYNA